MKTDQTIKAEADFSVKSASNPVIEVTKDQSYISGSVSRAGSYAVNTRSGKLNFVAPLTALGGNKMPLELSVAYNAEFGNSLTVNGITTYLPKGWKLNYQQYVYVLGSSYLYVDGQFNFYRFVPALNNSQILFEESGSGLVLTIVTNGYTITDDTNNILEFNSSGYLTSIKKILGTTIVSTSIFYESGSSKITGITDGMGRTTTLTYVSATNGFTVKRPDNISFTVTGNSNKQLVTISDADGVNGNYTYDTSSHLYTAKSLPGEKVAFTFAGDGKINTIQESVETSSGNALTVNYAFDYQVLNSVVVKRKTVASGSDSFIFNYAFDTDGRTTTTFEKTPYGNKAIQQLIKKDYSRQFNVVNDRLWSAAFSSGSEYVVLNAASSAASTNGGSISTVEGEEYLFSAGFMLVDSGTHTGSKKASAVLYSGSTRLTSVDFNLDSTAEQVMTARFVAPSTILSALKVTVYLEYYTGKVRFQNCAVSAMVQDGEQDCVNISTGAETYYAETSPEVNWYALTTPAQITYGSASTVLPSGKLTINDYRANEQTSKHNATSYHFWYNDRKGLIANTNNIKVKYGSGALTSINSIRSAAVTTSPSRTTVVERICSTNASSYVKEFQRVRFLGARFDKYVMYNDKYLPVEVLHGNGAKSYYNYDSYGNLLADITNDLGSPENTTMSTKTYDASGGFLTGETEYIQSDSHATNYVNYANSGNLSTSATAKGQITYYSYSGNGKEIQGFATNASNYSNANEFTYYKKNLVQLVTSGTTYDLSYDNYNRLSGIRVGAANLLTSSLAPTSKYDVNTLIYGNGQELRNTTDMYGRLIKIEEKVGSSYVQRAAYIYCNDGVDVGTIIDPMSDDLRISSESKLRKAIDNTNSTTYTYVYNDLGQLVTITRGAEVFLSNSYDTSYRLSSQTVAGTTTQYVYANNDADNLSKLRTASATRDNCTWSSYTTLDKLKRLLYSETWLGNYKLRTEYSYYERSSANSTTMLPKTATYYRQQGSAAGYSYTDTFTYDEDFNIDGVSTYKDGATRPVTYAYDGLGRLIRENNNALDATYLYSYDGGGNILTKKQYGYTLPQNTPSGTPVTTTYNYRTSGFKDQLLSLTTPSGTKSFVYDNAGNPTIYKGDTLTWTRGRLLASYKKASSSNTITNSYNTDGLVRLKSVPTGSTTGTSTEYTYVGTRLLKEERLRYTGTTTYSIRWDYIYTQLGLVGFIRTSGTTSVPYYYEKNSFGDVTAIMSANNTVVATYSYDAWGNCTIGTDTDNIGQENAIRYRSYYWDNDLQLYYLQTRYYDPAIGRFVNADDVSYLDPDTLNGMNLYSYCLNNPVMGFDPTGHLAISILIGVAIAAGVGAVVGATAYTASEVISYGITGEWSWSWGMFFGSVIGGAVGGAISVIPGIGSILPAFVTGFTSNAAGMGLQNAFGEADHSFGSIVASSLVVGGVSAFTAGILSRIRITGLNKGRGSYQQVVRQINTKFLRGQITRIASNTFGKILTYNMYYSSLGSITSGIFDSIEERLTSLRGEQ